MTVGTDPELFLLDNGKPLSAEGLIGGSKSKPIYIDGIGLQEDNVMVEFNTPVTKTASEMTDHIDKALKLIEEMTKKTILIVPSLRFDAVSLSTFQACESGCDPDFNAYTLSQNMAPMLSGTDMRYAGGHIHIGRDLQDKEKSEYVKLMDLVIGLTSLKYDKDTERRAMYGKAGRFRPKSYGVEYRSPSNWWIKRSDYITLIFDLIGQVEDLYVKGSRVEKNIELELRKAMRYSDRVTALKLQRKYAIL